MKKWTSAEIRQLRLRLGWSQAELARKLGCRQQTVSEWETESYIPQNAYSRLLDLLNDHVEAHSDQMIRRPMADILMKEEGSLQVSGDELSEKMNQDFEIPPMPKFDPQVD